MGMLNALMAAKAKVPTTATPMKSTPAGVSPINTVPKDGKFGIASIPTAEQRANTNPVMQEWVSAKDKENAAVAKPPVNTGSAISNPNSAQAAQDWINNPNSGQGGLDAYIQRQNEKMTNATNNNDLAMLDKLKADSARTGLTYNVNQPFPLQSVQQQSNSNADLINSMYQNNLASQQQAFEKQRQIEQQGLNGQETTVNQNALQNLNNNDSMANQQLKALQEVMANNGVRGGDSITATIGNQTAQQNGANSINQDKANQLRSIMEQRSLIDNNTAGDNTALIQKLQAARDGQMLDDSYKQQDYALNLAQLMGKTANGQNTLGGNQLALQQQNQNFNQGMANKQFDYQKVQDDVKNNQWSTQTENQMKQWAEGNKLNWAQFDQSTKQALAQIAISQQNANTNSAQAANANANQQTDNTLQREKFNWLKDPLNPANSTKPQSGNFNLDDYKGYVNQNFYVPTDPYNPSGGKKLDTGATERYILSQPITNDQKAQLYKFYGIPMK